MNLARAFAALVALALVAVLVAIVALGAGLRSADADVVGHAHGALGTVAHRIGSAYTSQIATLRSGLAVPLAASTFDGYGRRVVVATIGDDEGVDGGLYFRSLGIIADGPQRVTGARERAAIAALARSVADRHMAGSALVSLASGDVVVLDAVPLSESGGVAWARERIAASALHGGRVTAELIAAAGACCLILIALGAWIVWLIRRDAQRVMTAIGILEADPEARPALPRGDFGTIGHAVTAMSQRRAAAEEVAQRNERLAAIGRLAAGAAHEIRNPLNALRLQIDLLRRRHSPALDESSVKLQAEIDRLDSVVTGMLAVGSDGVVKAIPVALSDVVRRAVAVVEPEATARAREISVRCATASSTVFGDEGRLVQLVINMLTNAVDAAPPGTVIEVMLLPGPVLTIADSGTGIAPDEIAKVFEPFYSTKPAGTGLGLAIAHEIAHAHGTRIDVTSRPGTTTFRVDFNGVERA